MPLSVGSRLGHFEILAPLGAGGMGEVYRARDTRLQREVALKALPPAVSNDAARLARFEREARVLASLSHPNIGGIHGIEEADGQRLLVLELVHGETLADRLARGPMAVREALLFCRQVAEALEAAHAKGVVHRDLKPSNIKITPEGRVKVLDFGLAKAFEDETSSDISDSPTLATREGTILGTAAYMSPEQARGLAVTRQTDVWSFGCVLFETLAGVRPFEGNTVTDTLVVVLAREPDWHRLPGATPPQVLSLLRRCLEKEQDRRLHDIADVRIELEDALTAPGVGRRAIDMRPLRGLARRLRWAPWALGGLIAGAAGAWLWQAAHLPPAPPGWFAKRLEIALPAGVVLTDVAYGQPAFALSPDGTRLAFVGESGGRSSLFVRALGDLDATSLPGTEGGSHPFFSPDGEWLGFWAEGRIRKVPLRGGEPQLICAAPRLRGATWGAGDRIVFAASAGGGLSEVGAGGGTPRPVTSPEPGPNTGSHRWPQFLPGGRSVVFNTATASGREEERGVALLSLDSGRWQTLVASGSSPRYAGGMLYFARAGSLLALPFDTQRQRTAGEARTVVQNLRMASKGSGVAYYDVSDSGGLVYVPGYPRPPERHLVWVDRAGRVSPLRAAPRPYFRPVLSPDGKRLAVVVQGEDDDVWVHDLERDSWSRLTFEGDNTDPVWSADGRSVIFSSTRTGPFNLHRVPADGSSPAELLAAAPNWSLAGSVSPDGKMLAFAELTSATGWDVRLLPLAGDGKPRDFLATPFSETFAAFSPDGAYLAYVSSDSGRPEVYVRPYPGSGAKWPISTGGGFEPVWSRDGRELFYRSGDRLMVSRVQTRPSFSAETPRLVLEAAFEPGVNGFPDYDVAPDGRRFLMIQRPAAPSETLRLVVIPDWSEEVRHSGAGGGT